MASKTGKYRGTEPDYARGLDKEEDVEARPGPDFARGQERAHTSGDKYHTDFGRGLDRDSDQEHEARPDFARGLTRAEGGRSNKRYT